MGAWLFSHLEMYALGNLLCHETCAFESSVRMAEWSKAPDSRLITFLLSGISGLQLEAWVQIPLLTKSFYSEIIGHRICDYYSLLIYLFKYFNLINKKATVRMAGSCCLCLSYAAVTCFLSSFRSYCLLAERVSHLVVIVCCQDGRVV